MPATGVVITRPYKLNSGKIEAAENHNLLCREEVENAHPELSYLNHDYIDDRNGRSFMKCIQDRILDLRADGAITHSTYKNAVGAIEYIIRANGILLDKDGNAPAGFDLESWAQDSVEWAKEICNPEDHMIRYTNAEGKEVEKYTENIISAVLHRDESTPHIHVVMIPIDEKGRLNSMGYREPALVSSLPQSYYEKVGQKYGLERGTRGSPAKAKDIRKYHEKINAVFSAEHPVHLPGETQEQYDKRVDDVLQTAAAHINEMERVREREVNTARGEKDSYIKDDYRLHAEVNQILGLGRAAIFDLEEIEKIAKRAEKMKKIEEAIKFHPDKEFREDLKDKVDRATAFEPPKKDAQHDGRVMIREPKDR